MARALPRELMESFATDTGLVGGAPPRRYLWTDAFAVCNFLGLHRATGQGRYLDLALSLIDQVHRVLGRHREDDPRRGWISGLPDAEGERHPTRGGLRIGKPLPERDPDEPFDERLEWERDGQYFHYLTKWMHALGRTAEETDQRTFHEWAVDLAVAAHEGFFRPGGTDRSPPRMVWKASIDLGRALVPSMGHHDPLDALLTFEDLAASPMAEPSTLERLRTPIADAAALCAGSRWATQDSLGIGGLLTDAYRLARQVADRGSTRRDLLARILADARVSLNSFSRTSALSLPPAHRLAFRELGLAIGLHATETLRDRIGVPEPSRASLEAVCGWIPLASRIEACWVDPGARRTESWLEHRDINAVMLATSLAPTGLLGPS